MITQGHGPQPSPTQENPSRRDQGGTQSGTKCIRNRMRFGQQKACSAPTGFELLASDTFERASPRPTASKRASTQRDPLAAVHRAWSPLGPTFGPTFRRHAPCVALATMGELVGYPSQDGRAGVAHRSLRLRQQRLWASAVPKMAPRRGGTSWGGRDRTPNQPTRCRGSVARSHVGQPCGVKGSTRDREVQAVRDCCGRRPGFVRVLQQVHREPFRRRLRGKGNPSEEKLARAQFEKATALGVVDERYRELRGGPQPKPVPPFRPGEHKRCPSEKGCDEVLVARRHRAKAVPLRANEQAVPQTLQGALRYQARRKARCVRCPFSEVTRPVNASLDKFRLRGELQV